RRPRNHFGHSASRPFDESSTSWLHHRRADASGAAPRCGTSRTSSWRSKPRGGHGEDRRAAERPFEPGGAPVLVYVSVGLERMQAPSAPSSHDAAKPAARTPRKGSPGSPGGHG